MFKTELSVSQLKNSDITISILNGTDDESKLEKMKSLLKESGYTISTTGKTSITKNTTIINRSNQEQTVADELKGIIGLGVVSKVAEEESGVDFTIIIGEDY